ncbi:MAG: TetR/AcrR family transcriptional regulator [Bacteroidota bacterium]
MAKKTGKDTTEEKIMIAARKVFLSKGYAASRTRDIAEEAGINLALLNYYFKSKEKLFDIIMLENLKHYAGGIMHVVNDEATTIDRKIELIVDQYITNLIAMPDLPIFVLSELRNHPQKFIKIVQGDKKLSDSVFVKQYLQLVKNKKAVKMHPMHLFANIIGLSVFPFVTAPVLKGIGNVTQEQFLDLMAERKKMIPKWISMMIYNK